MLDQWIKEVKNTCNPASLGMILVHNGIVRATSKEGRAVTGMNLTFDRTMLADIVDEMKKREGIVDVRIWINEGDLSVGDDIMYVLVAGRFRADILPVFQELLSKIKEEIVQEKEVAP